MWTVWAEALGRLGGVGGGGKRGGGWSTGALAMKP